MTSIGFPAHAHLSRRIPSAWPPGGVRERNTPASLLNSRTYQETLQESISAWSNHDEGRLANFTSPPSTPCSSRLGGSSSDEGTLSPRLLTPRGLDYSPQVLEPSENHVHALQEFSLGQQEFAGQSALVVPTTETSGPLSDVACGEDYKGFSKLLSVVQNPRRIPEHWRCSRRKSNELLEDSLRVLRQQHTALQEKCEKQELELHALRDFVLQLIGDIQTSNILRA